MNRGLHFARGIFCSVLAAGVFPAPVRADDPAAYVLYTPQIRHVAIHEGAFAEGHYPYNHMASVEWFDGRFHCVWGGHPGTHKEGERGQVNLWAESPDFLAWSAPKRLAHTGPGALPFDPYCVQWQPNLLNYKNEQLWCVWSFNSTNTALDGLWFSVMNKGSTDWTHKRIQRRQDVHGEPHAIFASQNPVLLKSGRVLAPVTLNRRDPKHDAGGGHAAGDLVCRWNACFYTDDGGKTWACSTPIASVDDPEGQWEPFFYEQADGQLRAVMRNFTKSIPPGNQWRHTMTGTGAARGEPVVFHGEPSVSFIETPNCRPQVFMTDPGRYCMLQQDAYVVLHRDYHTRLNIAMLFSRSGADDFVAAFPISRPEIVSAYPQGVAHDGAIYLAYTVGRGDGPRGIEGAIVSPAPDSGRRYVWPRSKEIIRMQDTRDEEGKKKVVRANAGTRTALPVLAKHDSRKVIRFAGRASAGVEIDPVDFEAGDALEARFAVKALRLQAIGSMIFCSIGDRIPIRIGMPGNRPGKLYAYTRNQWECVGDFEMDRWHDLRVTVRGGEFSVAIDDRPAATFPNPLVHPSPRFYLGDGFEVDSLNSNAGSEFLVDLDSLRTRD